MSILFVLLTFIVIITINYIWFREPRAEQLATEPPVRPLVPVMKKEHGFSIPQDYCFHPGHTWAVQEGADDVRVGLDSFAADLVGNADEIEVVGPNRWVRQGQRLVTMRVGDVSVDFVAPVEGVVMAVNKNLFQDPTLATRDPYKDGWIARVKAPDFSTNQKNLMQRSMIAPWMHYSVSRLTAAVAKLNPALAQDGGVPLSGLLRRIDPELCQKLVKDFFLN
jgi:glycine cleavage system H lipoate-binding protein